MWTRIVGALVLLVAASYVIQWLLPKGTRGRKISSRQYLLWDIAPLLGFFGVLLLVLSFLQAARQESIPAWLWGGGVGAIVGVLSWIAYAQTARPAVAPAPPSALRIALKLVRTYGLFILIAFLILNLAVRWLGAALELFVASGLGAVVIVGALALFTAAKQKTTDNSPQR